MKNSKGDSVHNNEVLTREYNLAPETLWEAMKRALTKVDGVTLEEADDIEHKASFKTGVTWTSWGQNMIATVEPLAEQKSRVAITGQIRHTFLSTNSGEELHEKGFVRNLTEALDHAAGEA